MCGNILFLDLRDNSMSILFPMLWNKTTKHWRGSWTIPKEARHTDPGNSGGPEMRATYLPKTYQLKNVTQREHSLTALTALRHILGKTILLINWHFLPPYSFTDGFVFYFSHIPFQISLSTHLSILWDLPPNLLIYAPLLHPSKPSQLALGVTSSKAQLAL